MTKIAAIQTVLGVKIDGVWGPESIAALRELIVPKAPVWPFKIEIVGDDIMVRGVLMTCFGGYGNGISDPQDNGNTASGLNTKTRPLYGVSIAMDGRQFSTLTSAEHRALDGAPIPRLLNEHGLTAWHTLVEITIPELNVVYTPPDGLIDLGPGLQATPVIKGMRSPGEAHALDLSVLAAAHVKPGMLLRRYANDFEVRGSFRIIGGAKLCRHA